MRVRLYLSVCALLMLSACSKPIRVPPPAIPPAAVVTPTATPVVDSRVPGGNHAPRHVTSRSGVRASVASYELLDRLAICESGMRRVTGGRYHSYFQWLPSTFRSLGFTGMPEDYSYEIQRDAAVKLIARSGWGAFPLCSRKIGAR